MFKKELSCGVIPVFINIDKSLEFLLVRHKKGKHWGFPKGHREKNEYYLKTALRELKEETNISKVKIFSNFQKTETYSFHNNNKIINKKVIYFLGQVKDKVVTIQKKEIISFLWASEKEVQEKIRFKSIHQIIKKAIDFLKSSKIQ